MKGNYLWNILLKHCGHNVAVVSYGNDSDSACVCLGCEDCGEVVIDAEMYDLIADEEADEA